MATYALEILVFYVLNAFEDANTPCRVLRRFLEFYSTFEWEKYALTISGSAKLSDPSMSPGMSPRRVGGFKRISDEEIEGMVRGCQVADWRPQEFIPKFINLRDPLDDVNNLGRSVNKASFLRMRHALKLGAITMAQGNTVTEADAVRLAEHFLQATKRESSWEEYVEGSTSSISDCKLCEELPMEGSLRFDEAGQREVATRVKDTLHRFNSEGPPEGEPVYTTRPGKGISSKDAARGKEIELKSRGKEKEIELKSRVKEKESREGDIYDLLVKEMNRKGIKVRHEPGVKPAQKMLEGSQTDLGMPISSTASLSLKGAWAKPGGVKIGSSTLKWSKDSSRQRASSTSPEGSTLVSSSQDINTSVRKATPPPRMSWSSVANTAPTLQTAPSQKGSSPPTMQGKSGKEIKVEKGVALRSQGGKRDRAAQRDTSKDGDHRKVGAGPVGDGSSDQIQLRPVVIPSSGTVWGAGGGSLAEKIRKPADHKR